MTKRIICALLALVILYSLIPVGASAAADSEISPAFLHYLQEKFPNGKYWNHEAGKPNNPDGWTNQPCTHHTTGQCSYDGSCGCNMFDDCIQCFGFAAKLAFDCTGTYLHTWKKTDSINGLKAGDVVRINHDQHSIFITAVHGEEVTYADCNTGSNCKIRWNAKTTTKSLKESVTYVSVSPANDAAPSTPVLSCKANYKLGEKVEISWKPLPNADSYQIRISLNGSALRTVTVTEQPSYSFVPAQYGKYDYEVIAKNRIGASAPAYCSMLVDPHDCQITHFTDVKNFLNWSHEGIEFAVINGLFKGTSDTTFSPDDTMTRAMIATVLWRMEDEPGSDSTIPYSDVSDGTWYSEAVLWAYDHHIMDGVGNGRFDPNGVLTREQIVTVLYRYSNGQTIAAGSSAALSSFADGSEVSKWSAEAMLWAVSNDVIQGNRENGSIYLCPADGATRAQVATILMRFLHGSVLPKQ